MFARELKKVIERWQFWGTAIFMVAAVIVNQLITCAQWWGKELTYIRGAYSYIAIQNVRSNITQLIFSDFLPILACLLAADIFYEERNCGLSNVIFTRESKKKNIICKAATAASVTFAVVTLTLLVSLAISLVTFDARGHAGVNAIYITLLPPEPDREFGSLYAYHPYINVIVYILIRGGLAALYALFAFALSTAFGANRYVILISAFVYNILWSGVMTLADSDVIGTDIMSMNPYGSGWSIVIFAVVTLIISACMIGVGCRKDCL